MICLQNNKHRHACFQDRLQRYERKSPKSTKTPKNTKSLKQGYTVHACVTETHTKGYETYHMQRAITYAHVSTKYEQSKKNRTTTTNEVYYRQMMSTKATEYAC